MAHSRHPVVRCVAIFTLCIHFSIWKRDLLKMLVKINDFRGGVSQILEVSILSYVLDVRNGSGSLLVNQYH